MSLRVVIPVKPFAQAKQRLAPALNERQRAELARQMFHHVLATALHCFEAPAVIVVSRSHEINSYAQSRGAVGLVEAGSSDLNLALAQAAQCARGASMLLVLASDLPLLSEDDLAAVTVEGCAIAPDRHGTGTNALLWPTNPSPGFFFGEISFERHRVAALAAGFKPKIIRRNGLAHDVDLPDDLSAIQSQR